jgi:hypothetical protein
VILLVAGRNRRGPSEDGELLRHLILGPNPDTSREGRPMSTMLPTPVHHAISQFGPGESRTKGERQNVLVYNACCRLLDPMIPPN